MSNLHIDENTEIGNTGITLKQILNIVKNNILDYSLVEQKTTRKWIDGKPIYTRVYEFHINGEVSEVSIDVNKYIDFITDYRVYMKMEDSTKDISNGVFISYSNGNTYCNAIHLRDNATWNKNHMYIPSTGKVLKGTIYLILEYTKWID